MKLWLIFDVNYLCWRAFYALGDLRYEGLSTGVLFGFFRDVLYLRELFDTEFIVFCFDRDQSKRREVYVGYKQSRRDKYASMAVEELRAHAEFRRQVKELEESHLPRIGFQNVVSADGYEADDLIATTCEAIPKGDVGMIVGTDTDLFQLLGPKISIWNPSKKRCMTEESFRRQFGIEASQWADVKAIVGCNTDDVVGLHGIGVVTAIKFLTGKLNPESKPFQKIVKGNDVWQRNLPLVRLPYLGAPPPTLVEDEVTQEKWDAVMDELGMKSIRGLSLV